MALLEIEGLDVTIGTPLGPVEILVNNAGITRDGMFHKMTREQWQEVIDTNLSGVFNMTHPIWPGMRDRGFGRIINISSINGQAGQFGQANYSAAKAGVKNMTETLAVEWAPSGIRVNGLVPGLFPHEDEVEAIRGVPERGQQEDARIPAGRVGQPRERGWAATFLASPFASYVSGCTLVVDGANWQRRAMLQPEFTPIREQLGRPPFEP